MHLKTCYVTTSSDPDLRIIQCCTFLHHNEVMVSVGNASRIVVYLLVRCASEHKHVGLHKGELICNTCLLVCGFACPLDSE